MASRKRLDLDERRAQLVMLGRQLFSEQSYDEVSIDDVAQRAGISKGLLYHYFSGKRDFYVATVQSAAEELTKHVLPDPSLPPLEQVEHGIDAYLGYVEQNRDAYRALMRGGIGHDRQVQDIVEGVRNGMVMLVLSRMRDAMESPEKRIAVRGWVGFVEAASLDWLDHDDLDRAAMTKLLVNVLVQVTSSRARALDTGPA